MQPFSMIVERIANAQVVANGEHPCKRCRGRVLVRDNDDLVERIRCRSCGRAVPAVCARKSLGRKCTCQLMSGQPRRWPL
jgi:hypothetical protein